MQTTGQSAIESTQSTSVCKHLDVYGIRVRYKAQGSGEQVLLLHGWGSSLDSMTALFDALTPAYSVFAIDFPGHGKSELPPERWGVCDYTDCLLQVMDALGLERPHVLAHSFGGRVAIRLAKYHHTRVNKMILVDSAGVRPRRPLKSYFKIALAKTGKFSAKFGGRAGKALRDYIYSRVGSKDYVSAGPLRDTFVRVVNEDQTEMLADVLAPTLLVWGAQDRDTPIESAKVMAELIPNASLVVMDNAGHYSFLDQPHKFNLIVKKFLRS